MLAAGFSRRFGSDKRRVSLANDRTLLASTVSRALDSGLPVVTCLRTGEDDLAREVEGLGASALHCPVAELGMGASLAWGISHMPDWDGVLIALADMPDVLPATYCKAAAELSAGHICQPSHEGRPGHPVGFSRTFFDQLATLTGDSGARYLLQKNREAVTRFPVDDPGILRDIDTPDDLA